MLNRMMVLSDAPTSNVMQGRDRTPVRVTAQNPGPQFPPGMRLDAGMSVSGTAPDKDRSLFDFYFWHFQRARSVDEMTTLVFLAERDLDDRTRTGESTSEKHRARNRSILSSKFVGQAPAIVGAIERCTEKHVRVLRKQNGLDPSTGRALARA